MKNITVCASVCPSRIDLIIFFFLGGEGKLGISRTCFFPHFFPPDFLTAATAVRPAAAASAAVAMAVMFLPHLSPTSHLLFFPDFFTRQAAATAFFFLRVSICWCSVSLCERQLSVSAAAKTACPSSANPQLPL